MSTLTNIVYWPVGWVKDLSRNLRLSKMDQEADYLEEEEEQDVKELIATDIIDVYDTHLVLNKLTYVRCIIGGLTDEDVDGLPPGMTEQAHERIMNLANDGARIDICAGIIKIPRSVVFRELDETYNDNSVDKKNTEKHEEGSLKNVKLKLEKDDIEDTYTGIHYHSYNAFDVTYIITIMGGENEVKATEAEVIGVLDSEVIEWHIPYDLMLPAFIASRPYPKSDKRFQIRVNSETAAILSPTTGLNNTIDDEGMLFGTDVNTGAQIVINEKAKKSRHRKIFGSTGSGKSFSVCEMLQRALSFYQCRGCVITPKHELDNFIALAKYYKERGKVIYMGEDGDAFNPVQIVIDETVLGDSKKAYSKAYFRHVRNLKAGLHTWLNFSDTAKGYVESTIHWLYADNGIDRHKPETWKRETWPLLENLWEKWDTDSRDMSLSVQTRNIAASLAQRAAAIAPGGTFNYFNQQTTPIDYSNLDLIVFDISGVDEEIQDAVNVWVTGILGNRFNTDPNQETIIVVDEARVLLRNPELNFFLKDGIALGRSYGVWFWLITQNPSDFAKNNADEEFKMNIPISIIMGADIDSSNIDQVKSYFNLSDSQVEQLIGCQPGEGLLIVNGEVYLCRFEPATEEYATYKGLDIEEAVIPQMHFDGYKIKPEYQAVIDQSHLILKEMIEGDENKLRDEGWVKKTKQPTIKGRGSCSVWYKKGELNGDLVNIEGIGKMTFEHLLGVIQVQTWLIEHGIKCEVNHNNNADVVFWVGDKAYALEWEKAHSHTFEQLKEKLGRLLDDYDDFRFACAATPEEYDVINAAIPTQYMAPRGAALIQWLKEVTSGNMTKRPTPDNHFEAENSFEEIKKRIPDRVWEEIYPNLSDAQKEALINDIKEKLMSGYYDKTAALREKVMKEQEKPQDQEEMINGMVTDGLKEIEAL